MRIYFGLRCPDGIWVGVRGLDGSLRLLNPRNDLHNHSPEGFEWGYGGSGPAQLALALLADASGDDQAALNHHQAFKRLMVAKIGTEAWVVREDQVMTLLEVCRREARRC